MDGDRYRQRDRHTEMQKYSETHTDAHTITQRYRNAQEQQVNAWMCEGTGGWGTTA
jgi:dethiobiotin synthetase